MKLRGLLWLVLLGLLTAGRAQAGQPVEGPRTYRLYQGITVYVDNSAGRDFEVKLDLRDLNIYGNGPREVLLKVYDPDGRAVVREYIPDDGIESEAYLPRIGGWDHELQYYTLCRSKGFDPMIRWSIWSEPKRLATQAARTYVRRVTGAQKGIYRILLVGDRDHYATVTVDPALPYGVCGHATWIQGHHDLWKRSYVYVPRGTTGLHVGFAEPDMPRTRRLTITAPDKKVLFDGPATGGFVATGVGLKGGAYDDQVLRIDVSDGPNDYLLRATLKRGSNHYFKAHSGVALQESARGSAYGGFGIPALLCGDEETARALKGGAIYADGDVYWHPWQVRYERWLKRNTASAEMKPLLAEIRPYFRLIGPSDGRDPAVWSNWAYAMGYYGFKIWRPAWLLSKDPNVPAEVMDVIREGCIATGDRLSFALGMERVNGNSFAQIAVHLWYCQAITGDKMLRERYDLWMDRWMNEGWGKGAGMSKSGTSQEHFGHDADYGSYIIDNWTGKAGGGGTWVTHGILYDTDDPRFRQSFDRMMALFSYVYGGKANVYVWNSRIKNGPGKARNLLKGKHAWKGLPGPDLTESVNGGDEWFAARRKNYYIVTFHGRLAPRWLTETFHGQIGFSGGAISQLSVPGKGTVLNSSPSGEYGRGTHISNWRNFHIHGVVGEMWDGLPFAAGISEHHNAKLEGNVVTSSGDVRERNLHSARTYTYLPDAVECEVKLASPGYQVLMTLWSFDRRYAHVREAYEMIPYAGGKVTLRDVDGAEIGAISQQPNQAKTIVVAHDGYGVRIELHQPKRVLHGGKRTILVELVAPGGSKPTPAENVALKYRLVPYVGAP